MPPSNQLCNKRNHASLLPLTPPKILINYFQDEVSISEEEEEGNGGDGDGDVDVDVDNEDKDTEEKKEVVVPKAKKPRIVKVSSNSIVLARQSD